MLSGSVVFLVYVREWEWEGVGGTRGREIDIIRQGESGRDPLPHVMIILHTNPHPCTYASSVELAGTSSLCQEARRKSSEMALLDRRS
jgi:hypothetical protein